MSDETDTPQGGTEGTAVADASTVENASEATTEQPESGAENADTADDAGAETEQPKRTPWFQKRIDELTAKRYDAEREAAYWRGLAEGQQPKQQPQVQQGPPDRWDDPEGYDRYLIEQAKREVLGQISETQRLSTYGERVTKFTEEHPDYHDLVSSNTSLAITPNMANVIFESDLGPQVAYHLGQNPQEARRIAALSDTLQAKELGKIEARLTLAPAKPPAPQRTPPPAPPKTVEGLSVGLTKPAEEMTMAEYVAARAAGQI